MMASLNPLPRLLSILSRLGSIQGSASWWKFDLCMLSGDYRLILAQAQPRWPRKYHWKHVSLQKRRWKDPNVSLNLGLWFYHYFLPFFFCKWKASKFGSIHGFAFPFTILSCREWCSWPRYPLYTQTWSFMKTSAKWPSETEIMGIMFWMPISQALW